jgi:hypothetical protein
MKKLLMLAALVGAFSFLPVNSAQAGTAVVETGPRHVVVHHRPIVRVVHRVHRPILCRPYRHRVWWGARRWHRHPGVGVVVRI